MGGLAHADGRLRSGVCARVTLRSAPHQREQNFFGAHICRVAYNYFPQPQKSHIQSFRTLGKFRALVCPTTLYLGGQGGPPQFSVVVWNPNIFVI